MSEALSCLEKEQWKSAMEMEMNSIYSNDVLDLVELPADRKAIGSKWVFKKKAQEDGTTERYKVNWSPKVFPRNQQWRIQKSRKEGASLSGSPEKVD